MRFITLVFALVLSPPAQAHEELEPSAAIAGVIVQALAPVSYGDWAYDWGALSARISGRMRWHLFEPDPPERPPNYVAQRNGWIDADGQSIGVSASGDEDDVRELSFEVRRLDIDVLGALAATGVTVETLRQSEGQSHYRLVADERRPGWLTRTRECTHPRSRELSRLGQLKRGRV
ncbi:MAG: hypothetical protein ACK4X1_00290 [Terricaulis sp.]